MGEGRREGRQYAPVSPQTPANAALQREQGAAGCSAWRASLSAAG